MAVNLANWMHDMINDADKGGRCTQFVLVHLASGVVEQQVYVKRVPDKIEATQVPDWADLIRQKAKDYAQGIPGAQTFQLQCFHANSQFPTGRQPFIEAGYTELDGYMTEGPTHKGHLQQMMRHTEAVMARSNEKDRVLNDTFIRMMDRADREAAALRNENVTLFSAMKDLLMDLASKQHEYRLAEIEAQSTAAIKKEIAAQVPRLLNTITGKEIVPQSMEDTQTIEDLIDVLSKSGGVEEALSGLTKKLPPSLLLRLANRIQQGMMAREREAKTRRPVDEKEDGTFDGGLQ